jgi:membrane-bound ClpP family serine protease
MNWVRRAAMFCVGVYLLIYSLTVDAVQIGITVAALLLMGVITWDQIAASFGRDKATKEPDDDG